LAKVGQWTITIDEFQERLNALKEVIPPEYNINDQENKKFILNELIRQELLVQEAERRGLDKDKDVATALEEFRRTLLVRQLADQIVAGAGSATEQEARKYYNENKPTFVEWHLREIVLAAEAEAKVILIELLRGADFSEMAEQRSKGRTAKRGGDLGYITEFDFPQMEQAVVNMKVGDISSIISGPDGFYIVKLEDKKEQAFEKIKNEIISGLTLLKQQQSILNLLGDLEKKTPVLKNEKLLEE